MTEAQVGSLWPLGVALALGVVIAASLSAWWIAAAHPDAVVVTDPYQAGLDYNRARRAQLRAGELGWDLSLVATPVPGGVRVRVFPSEELRALDGLRVRVQRIRPAQSGYDREMQLERAEGAFVGEIPLPLAGRWQLRARAERAGLHVERFFAVETQP